MNITRWRRNDEFDPMRELDRLQNEINRLFDFDAGDRTTGLFDSIHTPAIDVIEHADRFTVECDLPGVDKDSVDISLAGNVLTIKGEKKGEQESDGRGYFRRESWSGSFQRTIALPQTTDAEKIDAALKDGVLRISLPKKEEMKPKRIAVDVA